MGVKRCGMAVWTVASIAMDYKIGLWRIKRQCPINAEVNTEVNAQVNAEVNSANVEVNSNSTEVNNTEVNDTVNDTADMLLSALHTKAALKLLKLMQHNGGIYIKLGQHLSSLDYLVPAEYCTTLRVLLNEAPQSSIADVRAVIESEFSRKVNATNATNATGVVATGENGAVDDGEVAGVNGAGQSSQSAVHSTQQKHRPRLEGFRLEDVFVEFEERPIGTASLAQVHKARLKGCNTQVAVKVQHRQLEAYTALDIAVVDKLVRIVSRVFPEFQFLWLAEEMKRNLPREMDFELEAANARRLSQMLQTSSRSSSSAQCSGSGGSRCNSSCSASGSRCNSSTSSSQCSASQANNNNTHSQCNNHTVTVPWVYGEYTTQRVLTMEFVDGFGITDMAEYKRRGIDPRAVSEALSTAFSEMVYEHGFVHCDPHAGNILVRGWSHARGSGGWSGALSGALSGVWGRLNGWFSGNQQHNNDNQQQGDGSWQIVLLDHGLYTELSDEFRLSYAHLWKSILKGKVQQSELL